MATRYQSLMTVQNSSRRSSKVIRSFLRSWLLQSLQRMQETVSCASVTENGRNMDMQGIRVIQQQGISKQLPSTAHRLSNACLSIVSNELSPRLILMHQKASKQSHLH